MRASGLRSNRGSSLVSFLVALPILCAFLGGILDFGRLTLLMADLNNASQAVCRHIANDPHTTQAELRSSALACAPTLREGSLSIQVTYGQQQTASYSHRFYDARDGSFAERPSQTTELPFTAKLTLGVSPLTPLGSMVAAASGGSGGFVFTSTCHSAIDLTVSQGGW